MTRRRIIRLACGAHALAALAACGGEAPREEAATPPPLRFDTVRVRLLGARDTVTVVAELAASKEQQTLGLMERRALAADAGMLFVYDSTQPPTAAFWMYRTRIPLDIAYADSGGTIRSVRRMEPCGSDLDASACPSYPAGAPFRSALEVNAGFLARRGIGVGDRMVVER